MKKHTHRRLQHKVRTMRTREEILTIIKNLKSVHSNLLTGNSATTGTNAPKALMQVQLEAQLWLAYWIIGKKYKSKLRRA